MGPNQPYPGRPTAGAADVAAILARAASGVGFSYSWGGGCWDPSSGDHGSCSGNCPSCSHAGQWGADCSGFVAKAWQVPEGSDTTTCEHPYTSSDFYSGADHWSDVPRSAPQAADAFVRNGHIFLYESGDAWGWVMAYEARGCATGIQHDSRTAGSEYKLIRREGL
jgi:hypothetical protein